MAVADDQRAGDEHAEDPSTGGQRLSLAEGLVLCLVSEGPTYGLVLARLLAADGSLGQIWSVPKGVVYYTLQQLELLGLIRMTGEKRTGPGRARLVCEITPAGRAAAEAWLSLPVDHVRDVRSELMVKLALHDRTGADSRPLVRAQLAVLVPAAAALDDRLRTASGFERTLVLWRHEAMTATVEFLTALAARRRRPLAPIGPRGGSAGASRGRSGPSGLRRSDRES
jgi:DNA-binding PadR family transcriptional regulator